MSNNIVAVYGMLFLSLLPFSLSAQDEKLELSLEQSMDLLYKENKSLKIAGKEVDIARNEHQKLNSFWYPSVNAGGAYVHMSNPMEVKQPLDQFTGPAKDFVHSILPNDELISSILDKIGTNTLTFPLVSQNLTTIDASVTWPVFTGGKRIYASKIGKAMVALAEVNRSQEDATQQTLLITAYFGLRLGQRVVDVKEETFLSLKTHYEQALKLEQNGMINRAERLFAQVSMDEAKRELESARKDLGVAQQALKALLSMESEKNIYTTTPLFINEILPPLQDFKDRIPSGNYLVNQLKLQEKMAHDELQIGRSAYVPNIALFGKQTLYSHGVDKYLMPRTMVGVGFTWNIFDGLNREKRIRQAKLTSQSLTLGKEKAVTDLEVGVDKFYSQIQNALDNVKALNTTMEMSEELVRIRKKSFQEGMATSTDVVDAEVMLSKVRVAFLMAYYQYDVALINLLAVCGTPESFQQYRLDGKTEHFIFQNE
ncbi:TolC family protein [Parabacteroides bouchesdurhonensis]|uniref:TolC family protein n=1 Tax=Parabacteroides bouchesdurhonensis TaxID=1936995 RepID=UPI000E4C10EE|nr:TolC family protein [Parabacteroides bouchesdurhonensis]RHJ95266.1 TolC family protein [Bacteroides sp. AM07-16]